MKKIKYWLWKLSIILFWSSYLYNPRKDLSDYFHTSKWIEVVFPDNLMSLLIVEMLTLYLYEFSSCLAYMKSSI